MSYTELRHAPPQIYDVKGGSTVRCQLVRHVKGAVVQGAILGLCPQCGPLLAAVWLPSTDAPAGSEVVRVILAASSMHGVVVCM